MDELQKLFQHVLDNGHKKQDRTGVGTISTFGYMQKFDLSKGFPIATTKKTAFRSALVELLWMIGGWMKEEKYRNIQRTNIKYLLDQGVSIWTEWPYKAYLKSIELIPVGKTIPGNYVTANETQDENGNWPYRPFTQKEFEEQIKKDSDFAIRFGDLGPVYQKQWRDFEGKRGTVDQLMVMIEKLKTSPDDRRNLTSFWNPTELTDMLLPPCHMFHQVWTRELTAEEICDIDNHPHGTSRQDIEGLSGEELKSYYEDWDRHGLPRRAVSLVMYQRSSDCFLGVPFDWVFYSLLTHMLADLTNMVVGEFTWMSGDTHLYLNSLDAVKAVMDRKPYDYPELKITRKVDYIEEYRIEDFDLIDYQHHPFIKVQVAV